MAMSMTTRTMPFVLGALCIIPVASTLYRLAEIIITGHWSLHFNPEVVDRLPLFIHGITMLMFLVFGAFQFCRRSAIKVQSCIAFWGVWQEWGRFLEA